MKRFAIAFALIVLSTVAFSQIRFIPNRGQWQGDFLYKAGIRSGNFYLTNEGMVYSLYDLSPLKPYHTMLPPKRVAINAHAVKLEWLNASEKRHQKGINQLPEYYNYFKGKDPGKWKSGVFASSAIEISNLYEGISATIESENRNLKYTYFIKAGSDPALIRMKISGADAYISKSNLVLQTALGNIIENKPIAWQVKNRRKIDVKCNFKLEGDIISFSFPSGIDSSLLLVIDPTVVFATYSGSEADNFGFTATFDSKGNAFGGGTVYDVGFPITTGAYQIFFVGGEFVNGKIGDIERDAAILKYSPDGKQLIFATYLGGAGNEQPHSMVVNNRDNLVIFGTTTSTDFPTTAGAFDETSNGMADIYIAKLSADGTTLIHSTLIGGSDDDGWNGRIISDDVINESPLGYNYGDQYRGEVIVDSNDNVYVATSTMSANFPLLLPVKSQYSGFQEGAVIKLDSSFSKLHWSTYIGGDGYNAALGLSLDKHNNVYVCGGTTAEYFFDVPDTYDDTTHGSSDAWVCRINRMGGKVDYATFIGTYNYDQAFFVQLDDSGGVYLYGQTLGPFPYIKAKYNDQFAGQFICRFDSTLTKLELSTTFGSDRMEPDISPTAFLVDKCGKIYVSGWGGSTNEYPLGNGGSTKGLKITSDAYQKSTDSSDFYVAVFSKDMEGLLYASFFGGKLASEHVDGGTSRFDKNGIIYQSVCAGCGGYSDFPVTPGVWSPENKSDNCNNLVFKVSLEIPTTSASISVKEDSCGIFSFSGEASKNALSYSWSFGDTAVAGTPADSSRLPNPQHVYTANGDYIVRLVINENDPCTKAEDSFVVHVDLSSTFDKVFIPNVFTVNNDQKNDVYEITGLPNCFSFRLEIFNRWGQMVHQSTGNRLFWDGNGKNGVQLPPGTYYYTLILDQEYSGIPKYEKTGCITLIR